MDPFFMSGNKNPHMSGGGFLKFGELHNPRVDEFLDLDH